jgi:replicative DNA helicase
MADLERRLICKIRTREDMAAALDAGVLPEWFTVPLNQKVHTWQKSYWQEHHRAPTRSRLEEEFPEFRYLYKVADPLTDCIERLREKRQIAIYGDGILRATTAKKRGDVAQVGDELIRAVRQVEQETTTIREESFSDTLDDHITMLQGRAEMPGIIGLATGFVTLDRITQGLQPGQLISVIGLSKAGKSTIEMLVGQQAQYQDVAPYYVNFEMSVGQQKSRYLAVGAHVDYTRMEKGELTKAEWAKVIAFKKEMDAYPTFKMCSDAASAITISGLEAKLVMNNPGLVLIDGVYFMRDEETGKSGDWQALGNLTRGLKRLAVRREVPLVITHQAIESKTKRNPQRPGHHRLDMFSSSGGISFSQDSDLMIGLEFDPGQPQQRLIKILASRSSEIGREVWVNWDWQQGFFGEELTGDEYRDDDED